MAKKQLVPEAVFLNTQKDLAHFFEHDHGEHAQALLADSEKEIIINLSEVGNASKNLDIIFTGEGLFFLQHPRRQKNTRSSLLKKKKCARKPCSLALLAHHILVCDYSAEDFLTKLKTDLWDAFVESKRN